MNVYRGKKAQKKSFLYTDNLTKEDARDRQGIHKDISITIDAAKYLKDTATTSSTSQATKSLSVELRNVPNRYKEAIYIITSYKDGSKTDEQPIKKTGKKIKVAKGSPVSFMIVADINGSLVDTVDTNQRGLVFSANAINKAKKLIISYIAERDDSLAEIAKSGYLKESIYLE